MDPQLDRPVLAGPFEFLEPRVLTGDDPSGVEGSTRVELRYRIRGDAGGTGADGTLEFVERVELPFPLAPATIAGERFRCAVRVLHLVAGVSYYKCIAPAVLATPPLSPAERRLVEALYDEGLREFAYRNSLAVPLAVDIVERDATAAASAPPPSDPDRHPDGLEGVLVPIGGGKDSALVADLIPNGQLFAVNPVGAQDHLAASMQRPLLGVRRVLDPLLRELVARGVPNGHVPVTAITSAIAVLVAVATGRRDVVMGIERSADEPSLVTAAGIEVNHQFSKSTRAEHLLAEAFAPTGVRYFSLLRPLSELAIGAAVAARGLGDDIVSCNRVFTVWNENASSREQRPCGECAKCLFTSLMLAPASSPEAIERQYGRALLDDPASLAGVRALWSDEKPFDCVGERLESAAAVVMLARLEAWRDQQVPVELGTAAGALLEAAGADLGDFLGLGSLEDLPEPYRATIAQVQRDLDAVAGSVDAPV